MAYQRPGPPLPGPVYYVGMEAAGHPALVNHGGAAPPPAGGAAAPPAPGGVHAAPMMMRIPAGCPSGLGYLAHIDQLLVHQRFEVAEIVTGWEMNNSYAVKNCVGQQVFQATEENNIFTLQACGPSRPFIIHLHDNLGQEVATLTRPLRCSSCCFPCCLQELEVQSPPGHPIGYVQQNWHPVLPKFTILNELRMPQLTVKGPFCDCRCMSDVVFEVTSLDESAVVGQISKQWSGFLQEGFTDADNFGISFPLDLDVKIKAVLLGACFLIDFMFFEHTQQQH